MDTYPHRLKLFKPRDVKADCATKFCNLALQKSMVLAEYVYGSDNRHREELIGPNDW